MAKIARMIAVSALALILGAAAPPFSASAEGPPSGRGGPTDRPGAKTIGLTLDVILEEVDVAGKTLSARPYTHVIPPSRATGGAAYSGCLPPGAKPTRYDRLPVMPEVGLQGKGLRPGMWITLRLGVMEGGALVVLAADENRGLQRVGINSIDAPNPMGGR
jgi:hypothetical protein